jgi:transcriptional regulator
MYVPDEYRPDDGTWPAELMRRFPLATLTTNGGDVPYATHVPMIFDPEGGADVVPDPGVIMLGHMNRRNPHWRAMTKSQRALCVFEGPHSYVSPTVYCAEPTAPTWNFTAVHVRGTLRKIGPRPDTLRVVTATVEAFEREFGADWDMTGSLDYFRSILPGVGAFQFEIDTVDSMFKLSQEKEPAVRDRVIERFAGAGTGRQYELACLMTRLSPGVKSPWPRGVPGDTAQVSRRWRATPPEPPRSAGCPR